MEALDVLILAAGGGQRLNGQPKAFLRLGSETLLERVVRLGRELRGSVIVAVPANDVERCALMVGERARVIAGGASRGDSFRLLLEAATGPKILLLDVVHPLVSLDLCQRALTAAGDDDAAAAVGRPYDQVVTGDGSAIGESGALYLLQKPIVFPLDAIRRGLAAESAAPALGATGGGLGVLELLRLAGVTLHLVESEPWNLKLTTDQDWRLITVLADRLAETAGPS